ncbi:MAG: response regulator [Planctomycetota bacterium]|nr:MAG: response regulator [Planctomycetota bacterium]
MISEKFNLLLVDNDAVDRRSVIKALNRFSHIVQFDIETAGTLSGATKHLRSGNYDVVLLDLTLPDSSGIDTVKAARSANSNIPIVVLADLSNEKLSLHAIEEGAGDYLVKGKFSDDGLIRAIRYAIERKRPEQKLKNAAKEWRTTFDSITDFIAILDKDFKITRVNRALADAYGVQPEELIGKRCHEVYLCTNLDCASCPHLQTLKTKKVSSLEFYEGQLGIHLEETTSPIIDDNGEMNGSVHVAKDITERKWAELERKEQDRLKSEFVATVSHEIRTPLSIFKNIISNALAGIMGQLSPKLCENLEMANRTINRLTRIVNDFLDITKIEAGKMELRRTQYDIQLSIHDTIGSLTQLAEEKNIDLKSYMPGCELVIDADRDRIEQVLVNLISNAIKYTPEGGHVNVRVEAFDKKVAVEVEDDGLGIGSSDLEKIFDRFVQIKKQVGPGEHGTGLGLSIAKEVVELHGGKIEVESELGEGTIFTVFLPLVSQYSCLAALTHGHKVPKDEAR